MKGEIKTDYRGALQGATYSFGGLNNMLDPTCIPIESGFVSKLINVDVSNADTIARRVGYTLVIAGTNISDCFSDGSILYYTEGGYIKTFDGVTSRTTAANNGLNQINRLKVNNTLAGSYSPNVPLPSEEVSPEAHFKLDAKFGTILEFYKGRIYFAKENAVYCSDMFDIDHCDYRQMDVLAVESAVTMIKFVNDGLYIGSENQTHFLRGNDILAGGFDLEIVADYGVILGTDLNSIGDYFPAAKAQGPIAIWTSKRGICTGGSGGNFINHSINTVSIPEATSGAALLRDQNGYRQYIVTLINKTTEYNPYVPINNI